MRRRHTLDSTAEERARGARAGQGISVKMSSHIAFGGSRVLTAEAVFRTGQHFRRGPSRSLASEAKTCLVLESE